MWALALKKINHKPVSWHRAPLVVFKSVNKKILSLFAFWIWIHLLLTDDLWERGKSYFYLLVHKTMKLRWIVSVTCLQVSFCSEHISSTGSNILILFKSLVKLEKYSITLRQDASLILKTFDHICGYVHSHIHKYTLLTQINNLHTKIAFITMKILFIHNLSTNRTNENNFGSF